MYPHPRAFDIGDQIGREDVVGPFSPFSLSLSVHNHVYTCTYIYTHVEGVVFRTYRDVHENAGVGTRAIRNASTQQKLYGT